ncbi:hypothetical protein [Novosphingopyxis sp.]|uniref:hypothetical protein n=1 Tax=Novosphingopyxis sp. TaxID=2709690 RepID=UPI003B59281A
MKRPACSKPPYSRTKTAGHLRRYQIRLSASSHTETLSQILLLAAAERITPEKHDHDKFERDGQKRRIAGRQKQRRTLYCNRFGQRCQHHMVPFEAVRQPCQYEEPATLTKRPMIKLALTFSGKSGTLERKT